PCRSRWSSPAEPVSPSTASGGHGSWHARVSASERPWLSLLSLGTGLGAVVVSCGCLKPFARSPPRINDCFGLRGGHISEALTRDRVEAWAIRPADRLERQRQHHRISDYGFKIHVVVVNLVVEGFIGTIREKLLEFDLDRLLDVDE